MARPASSASSTSATIELEPIPSAILGAAMTYRPVHSVVAIPFPEARVLTTRWRRPRALDAHVTIAAPFLDPARIDDRVVEVLAECLVTSAVFDVTFGSVEWFAQRVVYVAPEDPTPFEHLAAALASAFPAVLAARAGARYVAHLTVAKNRPLAELHEAAAACASRLPLRARAREVVLYLYDPLSNEWRERARVPLTPLG